MFSIKTGRALTNYFKYIQSTKPYTQTLF